MSLGLSSSIAHIFEITNRKIIFRKHYLILDLNSNHSIELILRLKF